MQSFKVFVVFIVSCVTSSLSASAGDWSIRARVIYNTYAQCEKDEAQFWPCIKQRALTMLDRASTLDSITLFDGITIERDSQAVAVQDFNLGTEGRSDQLDDLLWKRAASFLQTHSIRFDLPGDNAVEGREKAGSKLKKFMGPLIVALMGKGLLGALALGGLAMLAGKALLVSKLALALALMVTIRKLLGGGGSTETYEIVAKHPLHHHEGSSSNHVSSITEPSPGYFGHHRSLYVSSFEPAVDESQNYAHTKAYGGYLNNPTESTNSQVTHGVKSK